MEGSVDPGAELGFFVVEDWIGVASPCGPVHGAVYFVLDPLLEQS
jgi:hypothetical protein